MRRSRWWNRIGAHWPSAGISVMVAFSREYRVLPDASVAPERPGFVAEMAETMILLVKGSVDHEIAKWCAQPGFTAVGEHYFALDLALSAIDSPAR